jgi:uncharacterized protein YcnI
MATSIGLFSGAATASAHVRVDSDNASPGSTAVLVFRVPGESENGALTTQLTVMLPSVASARTEVMPGWTARLERDAAAGTFKSVTWTAVPGSGISPEQFALFRVSVKLPEGPDVGFPATQTYSDGKVVRWDQPPLPDGGEPEHPVPVLKMSGAQGDSDSDTTNSGARSSSTTDNSARWLAGGALTVAAVALASALIGWRRRS